MTNHASHHIPRGFTHNETAKNVSIFFAAFLSLSLLFQLIPIKNILIGVYKWHLVQPESWQGGLEIFALFILLCISVAFMRSSVMSISIATLSTLYLRLHHVLEPVLLAVIFYEIIISIGCFWAAKLKLSRSTGLEDYLNCFVLGLAFWISCAICSSWLGFGRFAYLRLLTVVLGLLSLTQGFSSPLTVYLWHGFLGFCKKEKIIIVFLLTLLCLQFAKSNSAFDYDSLWYGLRPEQVLIGQHSFFDNLGLVQYVFYYPKLFELFMLPLSNLGDYSFIYAGNTIALGLLALTIHCFASALGSSRLESLFITSLIVTIPAVANMGSTAKPDIFTTLLIVWASYHLWKTLQYQRFDCLCWGLACSLLSFAGKPTSLIYVPFITVSLICCMFLTGQTKSTFRDLKCALRDSAVRPAVAAVFFATFSLLGIWYRTYALTGLPTIPVFGTLWRVLGFQAKYPFMIKTQAELNNIQIAPLADNLKLWYEMLFDPKNLPQVVMLWTGNLTIYMLIVAVVLWLFKEVSVKAVTCNLLFASSLIVLTMFLTLTMSFVRGGDGNYYLAPVILSSLFIFSSLIPSSPKIKRAVFLCLALFIPTQFTLTLVSHPSWRWGTDRFSLSLSQSPFDSQIKNTEVFRHNQLQDIEQYVANNSKTLRVIGFGPEDVFHRLPMRYESVVHIDSLRLGTPGLFSTREGCFKFLQWSGVNGLIMPKTGVAGFPAFSQLFAEFRGRDDVTAVESGDFILLDISEPLKRSAD